MFKITLIFLFILCCSVACINNIEEPTREIETARDVDHHQEQLALRTDQDFCEVLNPKPLLHEVEGTPYLFGMCGHVYFFNNQGHWLDGPGLSEPFRVLGPEPESIVHEYSILADPYFQKIWRFDGDDQVIDLHGPWLSEPIQHNSGIVVQLSGDERGVMYQKQNQERQVHEIKLFARGETMTIAEGWYPYHLKELYPNDVRRRVMFYDEERAWVIQFDHPSGPKVDPLDSIDFGWSPSLSFNSEVRRDLAMIDRSGERLLHVKQSFTELDHYNERTTAEATLYQLDTMTPIVSQSDFGSSIGDSNYNQVCLASDLLLRSGCLVVQSDLQTAELYATNGENLSLAGERIGSDAKSGTVWVRQGEGEQENLLYDLETANPLGSIPPYKLPKLNFDDLSNHSNLHLIVGKLSSSLLIMRSDEDPIDLPSLYYVDLLGREQQALVDADHQVFIEESPYYYSSPTFRVSGSAGDELRWYVKRDGMLQTLTMMAPSPTLSLDTWTATDGRSFQLIEDEMGGRSMIKVFNAETGTTKHYALPERFDLIKARAYPTQTLSPGVVLVESSERSGSFLTGFISSDDEVNK